MFGVEMVVSCCTLFHCVHYPVAFVWGAHCSLRKVSFRVVGLDLRAIHRPL